MKHSTVFVLMAVLFNVCLISSNVFAAKLIGVSGVFTVSAADIIFPVSYILNDCMTEVYGFRKMRMVIWTGFVMNLLFILITQLVILIPGIPQWEGDDAYRMLFRTSCRATIASLLAFLAGSLTNALVQSRMKQRDKEKRFGLRAIVSSIAGETLDSLIFVPIVYWAMGSRIITTTILSEVTVKVGYEIILLPLTILCVKKLKAYESLQPSSRA